LLRRLEGRNTDEANQTHHDHGEGPLRRLQCPEVRSQVAGSTTLGVSAAEVKRVATGWSAKNQILGQGVYNDKNERVGTMDDIIIGAGQSGSYAIVGACGFLGLGSMTWRFQ
jgi:hypothetical protein